MNISSSDSVRITDERMTFLRLRIASRYYDRPDVIDAIARRMLTFAADTR